MEDNNFSKTKKPRARKKINQLHKVFKKSKSLDYIMVGIFSGFATILLLFLLIVFNFHSILNYVFKFGQSQVHDIVQQHLAGEESIQDQLRELSEHNDAFAKYQALLEEQGKEKENLEKSVVDIVRTANPAVVSIVLFKDVPKYSNVLNKQTGELEKKEIGSEPKKVGSGTGFIISKDGMIITNRHVVDTEGVQISVFLNNGVKYSAEIMAKDPVYDIAILKVTPSGVGPFTYLEFGNSDDIQVGEGVIAIGNVLGEYKNSVSFGIVSGLSRTVVANGRAGTTERLEKVIQTDAAINPGNSGGPLINLHGKVIGVNVAKADNSQSVGFALPVNMIKDIVNSVKKYGKIVRPFVGVRYIPVTDEVQATYKLPIDYGVLVSKGSKDNPGVLPGSPAEGAGIKEGDIITEIDGKSINKDEDFALIIRNKKVGDTISIKILRDGKEVMIYLVLGQAN